MYIGHLDTWMKTIKLLLMNSLPYYTIFKKRQCEIIIIAGDYNIDLLKVKQKPTFNQYLDTLISLNFFPKITLPTRLSNKHGTLIDNFLCTFSHGFLQTTAGIVPCSISDHFPYFLCLDVSPYTNKNPQYVKVKK